MNWKRTGYSAQQRGYREEQRGQGQDDSDAEDIGKFSGNRRGDGREQQIGSD